MRVWECGGSRGRKKRGRSREHNIEEDKTKQKMMNSLIIGPIKLFLKNKIIWSFLQKEEIRGLDFSIEGNFVLRSFVRCEV